MRGTRSPFLCCTSPLPAFPVFKGHTHTREGAASSAAAPALGAPVFPEDAGVPLFVETTAPWHGASESSERRQVWPCSICLHL